MDEKTRIVFTEEETAKASDIVWGMFHIYLFGCLIPLGTAIFLAMAIMNQMGLIKPPWDVF